MAVNKADEYRHSNPRNAFVDSTFVRGGGRVAADRAALYALADSADQLKENITEVRVLFDALYGGIKTKLLLVDRTKIGQAAGWELVTAPGSGNGGPSNVSPTFISVDITQDGPQSIPLSDPTAIGAVDVSVFEPGFPPDYRRSLVGLYSVSGNNLVFPEEANIIADSTLFYLPIFPAATGPGGGEVTKAYVDMQDTALGGRLTSVEVITNNFTSGAYFTNFGVVRYHESVQKAVEAINPLPQNNRLISVNKSGTLEVPTNGLNPVLRLETGALALNEVLVKFGANDNAQLPVRQFLLDGNYKGLMLGVLQAGTGGLVPETPTTAISGSLTNGAILHGLNFGTVAGTVNVGRESSISKATGIGTIYLLAADAQYIGTPPEGVTVVPYSLGGGDEFTEAEKLRLARLYRPVWLQDTVGEEHFFENLLAAGSLVGEGGIITLNDREFSYTGPNIVANQLDGRGNDLNGDSAARQTISGLRITNTRLSNFVVASIRLDHCVLSDFEIPAGVIVTAYDSEITLDLATIAGTLVIGPGTTTTGTPTLVGAGLVVYPPPPGLAPIYFLPGTGATATPYATLPEAVALPVGGTLVLNTVELTYNSVIAFAQRSIVGNLARLRALSGGQLVFQNNTTHLYLHIVGRTGQNLPTKIHGTTHLGGSLRGDVEVNNTVTLGAGHAANVAAITKLAGSINVEIVVEVGASLTYQSIEAGITIIDKNNLSGAPVETAATLSAINASTAKRLVEVTDTDSWYIHTGTKLKRLTTTDVALSSGGGGQGSGGGVAGEMLTDTGFNQPLGPGGWQMQADWSITDGKAINTGGEGRIYQLVQLEAGKTYRIQIEVESFSGGGIAFNFNHPETMSGVPDGYRKLVSGLNDFTVPITTTEARWFAIGGNYGAGIVLSASLTVV